MADNRCLIKEKQHFFSINKTILLPFISAMGVGVPCYPLPLKLLKGRPFILYTLAFFLILCSLQRDPVKFVESNKGFACHTTSSL